MEELFFIRTNLSPNAGKYGPEKSPYLTTFHAVPCYSSAPVFLKNNLKK